MVVLLRTCCLCLTPRTGSVALGVLGIILFVFLMVPHVLILHNHQFYITEFVKYHRSQGLRDIQDEEIPNLTFFSQLVLSLFVAYDVIYTFASVLLIAGVAAERRMLLLPWLVVAFMSILVMVIIILAYIIGHNLHASIYVIFCTAPFVLLDIYFWLNVYSTFHQMRGEGGSGGTKRVNTTAAAAASSVTTPSAAAIPQPLKLGDGPDKAATVGLLAQVDEEDDEEAAVHGRVVEIAGEPPSCTTLTTASIADEGQLVTREASVTSGLSSTTSSKGKTTTPPPPYEAVALDINKEAEALANGLGSQELIFFDRSKCKGRLLKSSDNAILTSIDGKAAAAALTAKPANSSSSRRSSSDTSGIEASSASSLSSRSLLEPATRRVSQESTQNELDLLLSPDSIQTVEEAQVWIEEAKPKKRKKRKE